MISGLFVLALTLICLFLLWKNYSESKKHSLEKLELENNTTALKQKISSLDRENQKLFDKINKIESAQPDTKVINIVPEFKYSTQFGSERNRNLRDNLVKNSKGSGYSLARSYAIWSTAEDKALQYRYNVENKSVQELAEIHERTVKSIASRLKVLNLL